MPKKHKSGGKKHPAPRNNRHNNNIPNFVSASSSSAAYPTPRSHAHSPHPHTFFSLKDEVLNTERHHERWTPSSRLRDRSIQFVSAGTIQPLEKPEVDDATLADPLQQPPNDNLVDEKLDDLEASDGAMAQMTIDAADAAAAAAAAVDAAAVDAAAVDAAAVHAAAAATADVEILDQVQEQPRVDQHDAPIFFVDTAGDDSLAFKGSRSAPTYAARSPSPTPSNSSEELVFRGRGAVTVRNDPPIRTRKPASPSPPSAAEQQPLNALMRAIEEQDSQLATAATAAAAAAAAEPRMNWAPSPPIKEEPNHWSHADGSLSHKQASWPVVHPRLDADFSVNMPTTSRKSKKSRKKQNKMMRSQLDPDDDDMLQDYIDNMDPEEKAAMFAQDSGDSTDDLFDRLLAQEEVDVELDPIDIAGIDTSSGSDSWHTDDDDDDGDDDDDAEERDELDSSDLESDLEYNEREQWEDDQDLRRRQRDAMTDEEVARLLAKQEELGLGADEMLLFDDSGFGDVGAARAAIDYMSASANVGSRSNAMPRSKKRGKKNAGRAMDDEFPDASLMADVLEMDPYNGFDIMDYERPSLKRKAKGRKSAGMLPEELAGLSDDDLIADLQSTWSRDRSKKAAKKAEREELRQLGLLGGGKKGNKFKPDLAQKYQEGISMVQVRVELREFLDSEEWSTKHFPPMDKADRKILHEMANQFNLKSKSVGSGKNRAPVLIKTSRTLDYTDERFTRAQGFASRSFFRQPGKKGKSNAFASDARKKRSGGAGAASYANGDVVGAAAPEIGASNFGRKLMEKMGWQAGTALGKEGTQGLLVPVEARIKSGKAGLG